MDDHRALDAYYVRKDKERIAELEQYIKWMHEWTSHIVPTFEVWQKRYK